MNTYYQIRKIFKNGRGRKFNLKTDGYNDFSFSGNSFYDIRICGLESEIKPEAKTDTGEEILLPPYNGPKDRVALGKFRWKVGGVVG